MDDKTLELNTFKPAQSGVITRLLYREKIRPDNSSSLDQTIGIKSPAEQGWNVNERQFNSTNEFPQPAIAGIGSVTSAGAVEASRFFYSQYWTVQKTGTGTYLITHNLPLGKYTVFLTPVSTIEATAVVSAYNNNTTEIKTFGSGGAADLAFSFIFYTIH